MALINCPECKNEISSTVKLCPYCGYKIKPNTVIRLIKKAKTNKKKLIVAITIISVLIICLVLLLMLINSTNFKINEYIRNKDYKSINNYISNNNDKSQDVSDILKEHMDNTYDKYIDKQLSYDSAKNDIDFFKQVDYVNLYASSKSVDLSKIKNSRDCYQNAENAIKRKDYALAIENYSKVIEEDSGNYSKAKANIKKYFSKYVEIILKKVKKQTKNKKYSAAISTLNDAISYGKDSRLTSNLSKIKKLKNNYDKKIAKAKKEKERREKERKKNAKINKAKNAINISAYGIMNIDSVGGVSIYVNFKNKSSKTIKYIRFGVTPYNRVGDIVYSEVGMKSYTTINDTGPYKTGEGTYFGEDDEFYGYNGDYWDRVWYNNTISRFEISDIEIEYTDNSELYIDSDIVPYVAPKSVKNLYEETEDDYWF